PFPEGRTAGCFCMLFPLPDLGVPGLAPLRLREPWPLAFEGGGWLAGLAAPPKGRSIHTTFQRQRPGLRPGTPRIALRIRFNGGQRIDSKVDVAVRTRRRATSQVGPPLFCWLFVLCVREHGALTRIKTLQLARNSSAIV